MTGDRAAKGGCLCGAVRFEGALSERGVGVCHCKQCRRFASGPFLASRFEGGVRLTESRGLKWWESSDWGRRGFCGECGASLFWSPIGAAEGDWAVSAGALDGDPDQRVFEHIFADRRPAYLDFADDAPRITEAEIRAKHGADMQGGYRGGQEDAS